MPSICVQSVGRTGKLPRMGHVFMYGGTQDWDQRLLDKAPNLLSSCQGMSIYTAGAHLFQKYGSLRTSEVCMPHKWLHDWKVIKMEYQPHFSLAGTESNSQQRTQAPGQVLGVLTINSTCFCCCSAVWLGWYPCVLQSQQTPQHTAVPVVSALLQPSQSLKTANCFHLICSPSQGCYILSEILIKLQSVTMIPLTFLGPSNHLVFSLYVWILADHRKVLKVIQTWQKSASISADSTFPLSNCKEKKLCSWS